MKDDLDLRSAFFLSLWLNPSAPGQVKWISEIISPGPPLPLPLPTPAPPSPSPSPTPSPYPPKKTSSSSSGKWDLDRKIEMFSMSRPDHSLKKYINSNISSVFNKLHGRVQSLQCNHVMLIKINENLQMKHITRWAECFADRYHGELFHIILFWICTFSTVTVYLNGQYREMVFCLFNQTPSRKEIKDLKFFSC